MMICPHCQSENREGAKFCNECGSPLLSCADKTQVIDAVAIGGLVQEKLSRLPKVGDHFVWGSFDGTVTRATNRRVQEVRLVSRPPEPETKKPDRRDRDKD